MDTPGTMRVTHDHADDEACSPACFREDETGDEFTRACNLLHAYQDAARAEERAATAVLAAMRHDTPSGRTAALLADPRYRAACAAERDARDELLRVLAAGIRARG